MIMGFAVEGLALLVQECLHLAGGGDWNGDIKSSLLLKKSSDL